MEMNFKDEKERRDFLNQIAKPLRGKLKGAAVVETMKNGNDGFLYNYANGTRRKNRVASVLNRSLRYVEEMAEECIFEIFFNQRLNKNEILSLKKQVYRLITVRHSLMTFSDLNDNFVRITAKKNRAKRKDPQDPNIKKARYRAKQIWAEHSKTSLLDTAYKIKEELNIKKSVGTVQEWIRDLNPNAKKKKISK